MCTYIITGYFKRDKYILTSLVLPYHSKKNTSFHIRGPVQKNPLKRCKFSIFKGFNNFIFILLPGSLLSHLFCNFSRKIFFFLLDAFTGLPADKSFYADLRTVLLSDLSDILADRLFPVFCLYIHLV